MKHNLEYKIPSTFGPNGPYSWASVIIKMIISIHKGYVILCVHYEISKTVKNPIFFSILEMVLSDINIPLKMFKIVWLSTRYPLVGFLLQRTFSAATGTKPNHQFQISQVPANKEKLFSSYFYYLFRTLAMEVNYSGQIRLK